MRFQEALFRFKDRIRSVGWRSESVFFKHRFFFNGLISGALVSAVLISVLFAGSFERMKLLDDPMLDIDLFAKTHNYIKVRDSGEKINFSETESGEKSLVVKRDKITNDFVLERGDNLAILLARNGFDRNEIVKIVLLLTKVKANLSHLSTGQTFKITYNSIISYDKIDILNSLIRPVKREKNERKVIEKLFFKHSNGMKYTIIKNDDDFTAHIEKPKLVTKTHIVTGVINTSLFADVVDADVKPTTLHNVLNEYAFLIDFQRDLHPGDQFVFILDTSKDADGDTVAEKVLYMNLILSKKKHEIFNFNDKFYNRNGESIKKTLLMTPVDGAKITSNFMSKRRHPILGYSRAHKGVDMAVPTGTPIFAAGDGVITVKKHDGGYGNWIEVKHNTNYSTRYAHMSRFANVSVGQRVRQRQVIGYVGMTGMATGPHLHYEVLRNGTQINPKHMTVGSVSKLTKDKLTDFKKIVAELDGMLRGNGVN